MAAPKWVCRKCGSENVQVAMWVAVNDDERVLDDFGSHDSTDTTYCEDCDDRGDDPHNGVEPWEGPMLPEYDKYANEE